MKLLISIYLILFSTFSLASQDLECPKGKVVVHQVTVPERPLVAAPAGGIHNTSVWIVVHVPRHSFSEEIKVQYDRHYLSLKKTREVERRVDFWFEVYDGGYSQMRIFRDGFASEVQEITTTRLPAPQCWGYSF